MLRIPAIAAELYFNLLHLPGVLHALSNAHHLRELRALIDQRAERLGCKRGQRPSESVCSPR